MSVKLIADSGSTKCDWCLVDNKKKNYTTTIGLSPYFLSTSEVEDVVQKEVVPLSGKKQPGEVWFYGTGMGDLKNVKNLTAIFKKLFPNAEVHVSNDMLGAAVSACGDNKGVVSILGTGSSSCYYNGKKIVKSRFGIGYILGDEGSGSYFGKKVIQHFLYDIFDADLKHKFEEKFHTERNEIIENVYRKPMANRYLASFTMFLAENRGHYMIENIIEDGINDFIHNHLYKFSESWNMPVHFVGSVANGFRDVIENLCDAAGLELGKIVQKPLDHLIDYHCART